MGFGRRVSVASLVESGVFVCFRMAQVSGSQLEEWYGEELRGYLREGLSWWAARAALYEAHPELKGRVGDRAMRYWNGERQYEKKPRQSGMSDLEPLWDWGLAKVAGSPNGTYRMLQRDLVTEHGIAVGNACVERWRVNLLAAVEAGGVSSKKRGGEEAVSSRTVCAKRPARALEEKKEGAGRAKSRGVEYPGHFGHIRRRVSGRGESRMVTVGLTCENGYQVAQGLKNWEGRPLAGRILHISTMARVRFMVGSHRAPWYILCTVEQKDEYHTLEEMLSARGQSCCLTWLGAWSSSWSITRL